MRQVGKTFSLLHPNEDDEDKLHKVGIEIRIGNLLDALRKEGYRIDDYGSNTTKFSILENKEGDLFEEVGTLDTFEIYTVDSPNLEKFLEDYQI